MWKNCEDFPIGISIPSSPRMGACCDRIARYVMPFGRTFVIALPAVLISRFRRFLPTSSEVEAASCQGVITECKVHDVLKQVGLNKSPGLYGWPYKVYLGLPHMLVPILTEMFNHWFTQGAVTQRYQERDHIAEERWQACLGGFR